MVPPPQLSGGHLYRNEDEIEAEAERRAETERYHRQQAREHREARAAAVARLGQMSSYASNVLKQAARTIDISTQLRVKVRAEQPPSTR